MDDDMPFLCPIPKCGKRFTNEDHLNVHSKTHEMSLALNTGKSSNSPAHQFVDQTPTPTKILKNFEEIGLFQELSKNPFDDAYKKALDSEMAPIPGPQTNELNTPTLIMTDTMRHVSNIPPLAVDKLKTTEKLKPSPLTREFFANRKSSAMGLDLSGKAHLSSSSSSALTMTRSNRRDLTSQDADSTSNDIPLEISQGEEQEQDDNEIFGVTRSVTSPHSAISSTSNLVFKSSSSSAAIVDKTTKRGSNEKESSSGSKVKQEPSFDEAAAAAAAQQQQCTMQVLLQLPNGQTVPISIPATINNLQQVVEGNEQNEEVKPQVSQLVITQPHQQQQHHHQAHPAPPALQPAPSKTRGVAVSAPSANAASMALKQRLKAQLQNQPSPISKSPSDQSLVASPSHSHSAFVPAAVAGGTSPVATQVFTNPATSPLMMMIDSPGSEVNMSDSSDYSMDSKRQKMSPESEDPEERRRKFLERNRAAAARCRQKRKHWIGNLERKADELQNTNFRLQNDVKMLRGEVANLKTLLLAHKDCPVTQQQRSSGQLQQAILTETPTAFSNQELAQVVPTGDTLGVEGIPIGPTTIMAFVPDSLVDTHPHLNQD